VDEGEFEFDFFSDHRARIGEESQEILWEEDPSDLNVREHEPRAPAPAPPAQVIMRRRIALAGVIALVLLIILIVVLTAGGGGDSGPYGSYLAKVSPIAADSEQAGATLSGALGARPTAATRKTLLTKLDGLVQQTVLDITRLQALTPPPTLVTEQNQALTALDLRLRGLQGIRDSLSQALGGTDASWEAVLSGQVDDLVSSDLIWDSAARTPANAVLQANGAGGEFFPQSRIVADASALRKSIRTLLGSVGLSTSGPALALGSKGAAVTTWQTQLNEWLKLTAPTQTPLTADGTFGPATKAATEALQTAQGITADGVVGPSTRQALQLALAAARASASTGTTTAATLKLGDSGTDVTTWQTQLNQWLKLTASTQTQLTTDGNFGAATQTATEALQTAQGISPTGVVDAATRQALATALAKSRG
jgi:peptidoglycan hydrolase-like protein with peptidoglycan-binding domain